MPGVQSITVNPMLNECGGKGPCARCFEEPKRFHQVPHYVEKAVLSGDLKALEQNRSSILNSLEDLHRQRVKL